MPMTRDAFMALEMRGGLTQMTLDDLLDWEPDEDETGMAEVRGPRSVPGPGAGLREERRSNKRLHPTRKKG